MSYDSSVFGEITITPPIPYAELKTSIFRNDPIRRSSTTLVFREEINTVSTPTGLNHDITAVGITVRYAEGSHYHIKEELRRITSSYSGKYEYTGALVVVGKDPGDIVRYRVISHVCETADGPKLRSEVIEENATITWSDGTKAEFS
jgi:hypothetical protein